MAIGWSGHWLCLQLGERAIGMSMVWPLEGHGLNMGCGCQVLGCHDLGWLWAGLAMGWAGHGLPGYRLC
jgi:hypothetical protein